MRYVNTALIFYRSLRKICEPTLKLVMRLLPFSYEVKR